MDVRRPSVCQEPTAPCAKNAAQPGNPQTNLRPWNFREKHSRETSHEPGGKENSTIARAPIVFNCSGISMLAGSSILALTMGLTPLRAQASSQTDHAPAGWFMAGSKPQSYRTGVDQMAVREGQASAYLQSIAPVTDGFGTLMQ